MTKALLVEYFDAAQWTFHMLIALFKVQPVWTVAKMQEAFMDTCTHLKSPPGSGSLFDQHIQAWVNSGYVTFDKDAKTLTAGITSTGKPIVELDYADHLVPLIREAIEANRRYHAGSAVWKKRLDLYEVVDERARVGEITPDQCFEERCRIDRENPLPK